MPGAGGAREGVRIDKWLWAARFFKTRGLASAAIEAGRVLVAGDKVKPARVLRGGERLRIVVGEAEREVDVLGVSEHRGPAPVAQALYAETGDSVRRRTEAAAQRRLFREPAHAIHGRPTKRDRRELDRLKEPDA
ncbi:MAG: RNA-binding S4 domain-containing protein [Lautropia sp.]